MDSYEYYLLYHEKRDEFIKSLSKDNAETLIALGKLSKNKKLEGTSEVFVRLLIHFIESDTACLNYNLDELLEDMITSKLFDLLKSYLTINEPCVPKLRIANVLFNFALKHSLVDDDLQKFCEVIIEISFKDSTIRSYCAAILQKALKRKELRNFVLSRIVEQSMKRNDNLSMQTFCFFFRELCQSDFKYKLNEDLIIYFKNDSLLGRKQGIFVIKCLLEYNLIDSTENWQKFVTIFETLEENQSHLILPSLKLLHEFKIDESFEPFWFILCSLIMSHENSLVKSYIFKNYIFDIDKKQFEKPQVLKILEALNVTYLFGPNERCFTEKVKKFVQFNIEYVFQLLTEVNWFSVPFHYILKSFIDTDVTPYSNSTWFLVCFERQTEMIPKRLRNIKIRALVKELYSKLLEKILALIDFKQAIRIIKNIMDINKDHLCLDKCLSLIERSNYDAIFCDDQDYEFLKYFLFKTHIGRSIDEVKKSTIRIKNNQKLIMEVMCDLNELMDGYEDVPNILVNEAIEIIWTSLTENNSENLERTINTLEIGLTAKSGKLEIEIMDHLMEIWIKINRLSCSNEKLEYSNLNLLRIILKQNSQFNIKFLEQNIFEQNCNSRNLPILTLCQALILQHHHFNYQEKERHEYTKIFIENVEIMLDRSTTSTNINKMNDILEIIVLLSSNRLLQFEDLPTKTANIFKNFISTSAGIVDLSVEFWKRFLRPFWSSIQCNELSTDWINYTVNIFKDIEEALNENDRYTLHQTMFYFVEKYYLVVPENKLLEHFKYNLFEAMYHVNVLSRDEQIENALLSAEKDEAIGKTKFRRQIAKLLVSICNDEFCTIVGNKILELSVVSKSKPRYYPNSKIHRLKLHHFQPLVFCKKIKKHVIDVLLYELLYVNNQLNVIYILEIFFACHHPNILKSLQTFGKDLNSQALKSIFSIAIMQMRAINEFRKAEEMLNHMFKDVFPFAMGQNFGVRIYSLVAMVLSFKHINSLEDYVETPETNFFSNICNVILESVKHKNCLKYFDALCNDFRFTKNLMELNKQNIFYGSIPRATNMSFEEVLKDKNETFEELVAADVIKEGECIVLNEEIELLSGEQTKNEILNLQRKYLPTKNQIPGESLLRTLPERFKPFDKEEGNLKPRSDLIIVASLIENNTNLGGLARTCEIFGISKYVIHSLKAQENFEFKTLSRTSEKWIQISEIKNWQLPDYLLAMKQCGYTIAGGEQSGNSVSLLNVKLPEKCIFLLGNEKKGIPSDLLALLDLVIEIPQTGVVRSLNVHVAGAILIWEYAKQHIFK